MIRMLGVALGVIAAFLLGVRVGIAWAGIRARRLARQKAAKSAG